MIKNNIIIIVLVFTLVVILGILSFAKISFAFDTDLSADKVTQLFINCPLIFDTALEYSDKKTKIIGGNLIIFPAKNSGINFQAAVRENEDTCCVTIGYPALPLESY